MILLDERHQVIEAIKRFISLWKEGTYSADLRGRAVGKELAALDPATASAEQVAEIIGNNSWARPRACGECGVKTWNLVQIGEPSDYESKTADLCESCLRAGALLASHKLGV